MLTNKLPGGNAVGGITVLYDEVFIVRYELPALEVYDSETLSLRSSIPVSELRRPCDIAASVRYSCLYVADPHGRSGSCVHRIQLNAKFETYWKVNDRPDGISATLDGRNVIVISEAVRKIYEYTTDGHLIRRLGLHEDIVHPMHAVQLDFDQFAVCYGHPMNVHQRVCFVECKESQVMHIYDPSGPREGDTAQLGNPTHMVADDQKFILIADKGKKAVLLYNPFLKVFSELITVQDADREHWAPNRLCLDKTRSRLYVADYKNKDVLVFKVKDILVSTNI